MQKTPIRHDYSLANLVAIAVIATIGLAMIPVGQKLDCLILRILTQHQQIHSTIASSIGYWCIWGTGLIVFAFIALQSGFRLSQTARVFALLQLVVIAIALAWVLYVVYGLVIHLAPILFVTISAWLTGSGLSKLDNWRTLEESRYYELMLRNKELLEARLQLVRQDEVERRLLAADLHDQVLNDLKAVQTKLTTLKSFDQESGVESIQLLLGQAMKQVGEVMESLCPSTLENLGLIAAIEECVRRGAQRSGFKFRIQNQMAGTTFDTMSLVEQTLVYRLVQEAVTNICKHAQASIVRLSLQQENGDLVIRIADNGLGFDAQAIATSARGLQYMQQRADLIGCKISWSKGSDGQGTVVEIRVHIG